MSRKDRTPQDVLREITVRDGRYSIDAYGFIFEALEYTLKRQGRPSGHVSGRELLEGIRDYALEQFGGLASLVFECWGVHATDDFGEIVFNLVEAGLMGKTENDRREDFRNIYDFGDAFRFDRAPSQAVRPKDVRSE
ncbi:MAG: hypothetical protein HY716_18245 [Planctomycetes bacterium]|nr:hypothetical protein [Planctomycetota bacterium]